MEPISQQLDEIGRQIVDAAFQVHVALGPGLLESAYVRCLEHEIRLRGLRVRREVEVPLMYKQVKIDVAYRLDLLVEEQVPIEIKAVTAMDPVFEAQHMTYMKLGKFRLGYLINFNVTLIKTGIKRIAI